MCQETAVASRLSTKDLLITNGPQVDSSRRGLTWNTVRRGRTVTAWSDSCQEAPEDIF